MVDRELSEIVGTPQDGGRSVLTTVQVSILSGLSAGLTDEAIAGRLGISVRTCRRHVATLFQVLGATSRFQAGVLAAQRGWVARHVRHRPEGAPS